MRRALFFALIFSPALARGVPSPARVSAKVAKGALEISWESFPPEAREWEAFLSLDEGRSFPLRVTPHLERSVRSFSWPIPWILDEHARLRIRLGDGDTEREFELAGNLRLAPARGARPLLASNRDIAESPAPGEEQTTAWAEWAGSGPRMVVPAAPAGARGTSEWRSGRTARVALPSKKIATPGPARGPQRTSRPAQAGAPRLPAFRGPSLSSLSRLNL
ncbi:MAG: hypothetical protein ACRD16_05400 [Thermoanaerobaculia bacterium]